MSKLKVEIMKLSSARKDRTLMFPAPQLLTWARAPWGWVLIDMRNVGDNSSGRPLS